MNVLVRRVLAASLLHKFLCVIYYEETIMKIVTKILLMVSIVLMLWNIFFQYGYAGYMTVHEWYVFVMNSDNDSIEKVKNNEIGILEFYPEKFDMYYKYCYFIDFSVAVLLLAVLIVNKYEQKRFRNESQAR